MLRKDSLLGEGLMGRIAAGVMAVGLAAMYVSDRRIWRIVPN